MNCKTKNCDFPTVLILHISFCFSFTVWVVDFVLRSAGFQVSPSVLPDVDKNVLAASLPTTQATYKVMDIDASKVLNAALTFSLTLDSDVKLTDNYSFVSIIKNSYKEQSTGK